MQTKYTFFCKTIITLLFISLSFSLFLTYNDILIKKRSSAIYIKSSKKSDVVESLTKGGVELNRVDIALMNFIDLPTKGWYKIENNPKGRFYFFSELRYQKADTMGIVIFAGDTVDEIFTRLAKDMNADRKLFLEYYEKYSQFLEGEILANRYTIAQNADEDVVVRYLLDVSDRELNFFAKEKFGSTYTHNQLHNALIMASIIHKESNNLKEMSTIASVINNRLEKGMRLQMDGTLCYGKYSHTIVTSKRIKEDKSHFNTYKYKGLPPQPICTVTMDALEAVTFPKETKYLYFMLNRDGTHTFAKDYDEHRKNIKKFRKKKVVKEKKIVCGDKKDVKLKVEAKVEVKKEQKIKLKVEEKPKEIKPKEVKSVDNNGSKIVVDDNITKRRINKDLNDSILSVF